MAGLEAPWLAMVSSPEREERRREEGSTGRPAGCVEEERGDAMVVELYHKEEERGDALYKLLLLLS
jgi:hypothetical protein